MTEYLNPQLKSMIKRESSGWGYQEKKEKRTLGERDRKILYDLIKHKCENCGIHLEYKQMMSGHKKAYSKNGKTNLANSVGLCWSCNNLQGKDSWETFRKKQNKPITPTATSHLIKTRVKSDKPKKNKD